MPHLHFVRTTALLIFLLAPSPFTPPVAAAPIGGRVALVVGVGDYRGSVLNPLKNPTNDARLIHRKLKKLGFRSRLLTDPNRSQLRRALKQLERDSATAAISMFYYAGHGFEVDGQNVILPSDARVQLRPTFRADKAVGLSEILQSYAGSDAVKLIVLDACRDDPKALGLLPVGFAQMNIQAERNTLLVFSTSPNDQAADGNGDHSPFSEAFGDLMMRPNLELQAMLRKVKKRVDQVTGGQLPWSQDSLQLDVYLNRKSGGSSPPPVQPPRRRPPSRPLLGSLIARRAGWIRSAPQHDSLEVLAYGKGTQFDSARRATNSSWTYVTLATGAKGYVETSNLSTARVAKTPSSAAGSVRDCDACPEMFLLPPGSFVMGSDQGNPNETPAHSVRIPNAFYIGRTEVSQTQWRACVADGGCRATPNDANRGTPDAPVVRVNYRDANSYAQWLSGRSGKRYRLPSEAEWEYAAQGGSGAQSHSQGNANCKRCSGRSARRPLPPDGFAANDYGLVHMLGNVFEWVTDCANRSYRMAPNNGTAWTRGDCNKRGLRGGSWSTSSRSVRSASRRFTSRRKRSPDIGFRVVRELR